MSLQVPSQDKASSVFAKVLRPRNGINYGSLILFVVSPEVILN